MLPAARVSDMIVSPATMGAPVPIIPPGAATVLIAGMPAARMADLSGAGGTVIGPGAPTVMIGG